MVKDCMNIHANTKRPYSDGLRVGDFIWVSGQIGMDYETNTLAGDDIQSQTRKAMDNVLSVLAHYDLCSCQMMRVTIYMTDLQEEDAMNEAYAPYFKDTFPSCTVVGVNKLPNHAKIQIECYALDIRALEILCKESKQDEIQCDCNDGVCE